MENKGVNDWAYNATKVMIRYQDPRENVEELLNKNSYRINRYYLRKYSKQFLRELMHEKLNQHKLLKLLES